MSELRERKKKSAEAGSDSPKNKEKKTVDDAWAPDSPSPVSDSPSLGELALPCVVVFLVAALCYANSLEGDMLLDDDGCIKGNKDVTDPSATIYDIFQHDYWGASVWDRNSHKSYRPLTILSYRMNFQLVRDHRIQLQRMLRLLLLNTQN